MKCKVCLKRKGIFKVEYLGISISICDECKKNYTQEELSKLINERICKWCNDNFSLKGLKNEQV